MDCVGFAFKFGVQKSHWTGLYQLDLRVSWKRKDTEGGQGEDWSVRGMKMGKCRWKWSGGN